MNFPLKLALSLCCAALFTSGCTTSNTPTAEKSQSSKWIVLFDGKSTDAFRGYKRDTFPDKSWNIEGGALHTVVGERADIITRERFKDFELEFEWKVTPAGNSGVFYGVQETDGPAFSTGPEIQILDDVKHQDGRNPKTAAGSLYALIGPNDRKTTKPVGEFNTMKVVAKNGQIEHWLNGKKVVEYTWGSPEVKALIAGSKFSKMPRFMENLDGHLAFQHHGQEVWFRNIRVRRL